MATTVQNPPDLETRSKAFAERFNLVTLESKEHLAENCVKAAKVITKMIEAKGVSDAQMARVQLDAAKFTLKLHGLDVDKIEAAGPNGGPVSVIILPAKNES